jgi:hypothetical protein
MVAIGPFNCGEVLSFYGKILQSPAPDPSESGADLAEGKGFEPLVRGYHTLVFKTSSFGRSDSPPESPDRNYTLGGSSSSS